MKSIKGYKKRCLPVCLLLMLFINVLPAKAALDAEKMVAYTVSAFGIFELFFFQAEDGIRDTEL